MVHYSTCEVVHELHFFPSSFTTRSLFWRGYTQGPFHGGFLVHFSTLRFLNTSFKSVIETGKKRNFLGLQLGDGLVSGTTGTPQELTGNVIRLSGLHPWSSTVDLISIERLQQVWCQKESKSLAIFTHTFSIKKKDFLKKIKY